MKQKGFSLIELLVVLGIIAVLTGLVAFNFNQARTRARDVTRKNDLKQIREALELYRNDNSGRYPDTGSYDALMATYLAPYIQSELGDPKIALTGDPSSWVEYTYSSTSPNLGYVLSVCLENKTDDAANGDLCGTGNSCKYYVIDIDEGTQVE